MNNIREILNCEILSKNMYKVTGICENNRCQYLAGISRYAHICNGCKKMVCRLCVNLNRKKCAICGLSDKQKNIIREHEKNIIREREKNVEECRIHTSICNNCDIVLITCADEFCGMHDGEIWEMFGDDKDCVKCKKN